MQKIIVARYPSKCRVCKGSIAAGERVYWLGKSAGLQHMNCHKPAETSKPETTEKEMYTYTQRFTDLREKFRKFVDRDFSFVNHQANREVLASLRSGMENNSSWYGCTLEEMQGWLNEGFVVEGLAGIDPSLFPSKPRRKIRYSEEGDEMLIDLVLSGVDEHFIEWQKRVTKPGLTVDIQLSFNSNFPAKIIVDFERWLARMLQSIDEAGINAEVLISSKGRGAFRNDRSGKIFQATVKVKESGEATDFASWSAMFSPGGFRMLTFLNIVQGADFHDHDVSFGLGSAVYANDWKVEYHEETNRLVIENPGDSKSFPEFEMTEKFRAILDRLTS